MLPVYHGVILFMGNHLVPILFTKRCNTCHKDKPYDAFNIVSIQKDGHSGRCRQCEHDQRDKRTDEEIEHDRRLRQVRDNARREQIRAYDRKRGKLIHRREAKNARGRAARAEARTIRETEKKNLPPITSKICPKCDPPLEKPIGEFPLSKNSADGHGSYCRECKRKHERSEQFKISKNRRKRIRMLDPMYRIATRRTINEWRRANPLMQRELTLRRNARKKAAKVGKVSYKRILERDGYWCYICEQSILPHQKMEFDHVIPLIPRPGEPQGMHTESNIKPSHDVCNRRKTNKRFEDLTPFDRRGI